MKKLELLLKMPTEDELYIIDESISAFGTSERRIRIIINDIMKSFGIRIKYKEYNGQPGRKETAERYP